jgi:hypothetical protein
VIRRGCDRAASFAVAVLALLAFGVATAQNLVVNPGFDDLQGFAPVGWDPGTQFVAYCGSNCAPGTDDDPAVAGGVLRFGNGGPQVEVAQLVADLPSGEADAFVFSFSVRRPSSPAASYRARVDFLNHAFITVASLVHPPSELAAAPADWESIELRLDRADTPFFDEIAYADIVLYGVQNTRTFSGHYGAAFDDVTLTAVIDFPFDPDPFDPDPFDPDPFDPDPPDPTNLVWSGPPSLSAGVREAFTLTRIEQSVLAPPPELEVLLSADPGVTFYAAAEGGAAIDRITLASGVVEVDVYVEATAAGSVTLTAQGGDAFADLTIDVEPGPPATLTFVTQPPASVEAGATFAVTIEVRDAYGNLATNAQGEISVRMPGFVMDGSSLAGWSASNGIVVAAAQGNPAPAIDVPGGARYAARALPGLGPGAVIEVDANVRAGSLANFFFAADASGQGQMFRFDARNSNSGIANTGSWGSWGVPGFDVEPTLTGERWYRVRLELGATTVAVYVDGVWKQNAAYTPRGEWIALHGDGLSGGFFDNVRVRGAGENALDGTLTATLAQGTATFGDLVTSLVQSGATLIADGFGLTVASQPFTIAAGPPASIAAQSGDAQSGAVGAALPNPVAVIVRDADGNPVEGAQVGFTTDDGSLSSAVATTDASGIAEVIWTLPTTLGAKSLQASVGAFSVTLSATAVPGPLASLTWSGGPDAVAGLRLGLLLERFDAYGHAITAGAQSVTLSATAGSFFAAASGGSALASITIPAGAGGVTAYYAHTVAGGVTATATAGAVSADAALTVAPAAASAAASLLTPASANAVVATGEVILTVTARDAFGNARTTGGDDVAFVSLSGGGTLASVVDVGDGTYTAAFTAPTTAGTATLGATLGGVRVRGGGASDAVTTITLDPAAADPTTSLLTAIPEEVVADGAATTLLTLQLRDVYGNDGAPPPLGATPLFVASAGTLLASAEEGDPGVWTQALQAPTAAGIATVTATFGPAPAAAPLEITFVAGPPDALSIVVGDAQQASVASAVATAPRVLVVDAFGNPVADAVVSFAASGDGVASPALASTDVAGEATTSWTLASAAGENTLTATVGALSITFGAEGTPGPAAALTISPPATATAGVRTSVTLARFDAFGNRVASGAGEVELAGEGVTYYPAAQGGSAIAGIVIPDGAEEVQLFFVATQAGVVTLEASLAGSSVEEEVTITAAAPARLALAQAPVAGVSGGVLTPAAAVVFEDAFGNRSAPAQATVTAAAATAGATLSGTTQRAVVGGEASFDDLIVRGVAGVPITLRFTAAGVDAAEAVVTLGAGAPAQLAVVTQPVGGSASGEVLATQPSIEVRDAEGNHVDDDDATEVTVAIGSGAGGTLAGTLTLTAVGGRVDFTDLALAGTVGETYVLSFSAGNLTGVAAQPIGVTPGAAASLVVVRDPVAAAAGVALATQPQLEIRDAQGNVVTDAVGVVVTASVAVPALLTGTVAATSVAGVVTFADLALGGPAATPIVIEFTSSEGLIAVAPAVTLTAGAAATLAIVAGDAVTGSVATPTPNPPTLVVRDAFDNPVAGVTVTFAVASGGGGVNPSSVVTGADGRASTTWTLGPAPGANTLSATAPGATPSPLTFTATALAGVPVALAFAAAPAARLAGTILPSVEVRFLDSLGNPALAASEPVTLTLATGSSALAGVLTVTPVAGVATFPCLWLERPAAALTLRASANGLPAVVSAPFPALGASLTGRLLLDRDGSRSDTPGDGVVVGAEVSVQASGTPVAWNAGADTTGGACTPLVRSLAVTDVQGRFTIHGLPAGAVSVAVGGAVMAPLLALYPPQTPTLQAGVTTDLGALPAYPGVLIEGRVFRDDGEGGGVANDGVRQAAEVGVAGIDLALRAGSLTVTTVSGAQGAFSLLLPLATATSADLTLTPGAPRAATGFRLTAAGVERSGLWIDPAAATAVAALGSLTPGVRFALDLGVVPRATFAITPGDGFVASPGSLRTVLLVHPGTDATLRVTATGSAFASRLDPDPDLCPGLTVTPAGAGVWDVALATPWPRAAAGTAPCRLVHAVVVPSGVAGGTTDATQLRLDVRWRNRSGDRVVTESATAAIAATVLRGGSLALSVASRLAGGAAAFTPEIAAPPGALIETQVTYRNPGSSAISAAVVRVDFGADLLPTDTPARVTCPNGATTTTPLLRRDGVTVLEVELARFCGDSLPAGAVGSIHAIVRVR